MSGASWSGSLLRWNEGLTALKTRIGPVFGRAEVRATVCVFIDGLLSAMVCETGWQPAELAKPYRVQLLLGRTVWDADALRERMRAEVLATLGDPSGMLVVAETDFLRKGTHSVGVGRQHSGTVGTDRLRHQDRGRA